MRGIIRILTTDQQIVDLRIPSNLYDMPMVPSVGHYVIFAGTSGTRTGRAEVKSIRWDYSLDLVIADANELPI